MTLIILYLIREQIVIYIQMSLLQQPSLRRYIHVCTALNKVQSGRYKPTPKRTFRLTYEMANPPHYIAHRKSWNSWNTCM